MSTTPLRRRATALTVTLLSATFALTACGSHNDDSADSGTTTSETRSFDADNGTIKIPADPQRIVALGNAVAPVIYLGVEPVGVTEMTNTSAVRWFSDDEMAAYEGAEKLGTDADPDLEQIASLKPDLIVIQWPQAPYEQDFAPMEARLQAIAPTVFIANVATEWKAVGERTADAIGASSAFTEQKSAYDELVAQLADEFASVIESTTFALINRYPVTPEGSFAIEWSGGFCPAYATEVGLDFPAAPENGKAFEELSMERLSDLADYDVLLYALEADGEPRKELTPVLESNAWKALPQVTAGHALGVACPAGASNYSNGITNLESLRDALTTLTDE